MRRILPFLSVFMIWGLSLPIAAQKKNAAPKPAAASSLSSETFSALSFRSIGPAVVSGRIADFAVNPNNHSEYYVAAASGGVWKTTNRGVTYEPIFDGEGAYSIGCVTMAPSRSSVIWVGTGENNNQRSVAYGDGVYKSEDGGKSWKNMGLKDSEHIAEIVIHPTNPAIIYVAAYGPLWREGGDRGVYKSVDGGLTWKQIKYVSAYTGCNDLVMDPRNPDVLYAAFHQRMRKVHTYIGGGPESALFKSTDGGLSWSPLTNGLPGGDKGRMGLAISPVNPDVLYTVVEAQDGKGGIYRSTDAGASWEKRSGYYTSGNYYQEITCDPVLSDRIFITDTYYHVSSDGGKTTTNLGEIHKHIDNHAIWVDPSDGNHLLVGSDGGIYETWDFAKTWDFKANLPVTQFYKVSVDNAVPFYHIHGGTQDNLSLGGPSRNTSINGILNSDWFVTSVGDGFETQVDPENPDIIYAQSQYGGLIRFDKRSGEFLFIKPIEGANEPALRWNWDAPLLISAHMPSRLYFGANRLYRTDDRGQSWTAISPDLSRQMDRNKLEVMGRIWSVDAIAKNGSTDIYGQLTTIAESIFDENVIWAGTDDGLIQLTTDGGKNWTRIENLPGAPAQSYVNQIITSRHDKNTAYVCFNHHRYGDFKPYVWKTSDLGKTWKPVQSNLPSRGSVYTIAEDHKDPNLLFVGTEFGCFFSQDGGGEWIQLKSGLPVIAVRDIEIQRREDDLVLGTFGRGFYVLDNYAPLRHFKKDNLEKESEILPVKDSWVFVESMPFGLRDKAHQGSSLYTGPNPPVGAVFTYYLKVELKTIREKRQETEKQKYEKGERVYYPSMDSLRLEDEQADPYLLFTIRNRAGKVIRHLKESPARGLHRLVWDFRYANPAPVEGRYTPAADVLFGEAERGHLAAPGEYTVSMSKFEDGKLTELVSPVAFRIFWLDQHSLPINPEASESFWRQVSELRKAISATTDITSQLESRLSAAELAIHDMLAPVESILPELHGLKQQHTRLKRMLMGDATLSSREFETPPSISDRANSLQSALWNSTADIPDLYRESFGIADEQLTELLPQLRKLDEDLRVLEGKLEIYGAPYTPGRWPEWGTRK